VAQVVRCLLCKRKALSPNPGQPKAKQNKTKIVQERRKVKKKQKEVTVSLE
jgi:hypothetical protein